jgi:hypothetical protein
VSFLGCDLVPKLLLGDAIGAKLLLGSREDSRDFGLGAKQSFAGNGVPKRELGNQKKYVQRGE